MRVRSLARVAAVAYVAVSLALAVELSGSSRVYIAVPSPISSVVNVFLIEPVSLALSYWGSVSPSLDFLLPTPVDVWYSFQQALSSTISTVLPTPVDVRFSLSRVLSSAVDVAIPDPVKEERLAQSPVGAYILYFSSINSLVARSVAGSLVPHVSLQLVQPKEVGAPYAGFVGASLRILVSSWSQDSDIDSSIAPSIGLAVSRAPVVQRSLALRVASVQPGNGSVSATVEARVLDPRTRTVDRTATGVVDVFTGDGEVLLGFLLVSEGTGTTTLTIPNEYVGSDGSVSLYAVLHSASGGSQPSGAVCLTGKCPFSFIDVPTYVISDTASAVEVVVFSQQSSEGASDASLGGRVESGAYGVWVVALAILVLVSLATATVIRRVVPG